MGNWTARTQDRAAHLSDQDGYMNLITGDVISNGERRQEGSGGRVALVLNHTAALAHLPAARYRCCLCVLCCLVWVSFVRCCTTHTNTQITQANTQ